MAAVCNPCRDWDQSPNRISKWPAAKLASKIFFLEPGSNMLDQNNRHRHVGTTLGAGSTMFATFFARRAKIFLDFLPKMAVWEAIFRGD